MRQAGKLGRTAPHPESTHPRLKIEHYMDMGALPVPPATVDRASKVSNWPMYLNDTLGDCTCAAVGHAIQGWTATAGAEKTITNDSVLSLYEAVGGYVPGDPNTDQGANIQDVLTYWNKTGVAGDKISAFAQLSDFTNVHLIKLCLYLFGTVYLGINFPDSAMTQFNNGEPWSYVPGSQIDGGHAIVLQKQVMAGPGVDGAMDIITWGAVQPMTYSFVSHYVEEAWVMLTPDWIASNGDDVDGFSLSALQADFNEING